MEVGNVEHVYGGITFSGVFPTEALEKVPDFEFRPDDVLIATYPKAGTTWIQQIAWLIMNDVDIKASRETSLESRSPFIEKGNQMEHLTVVESPRVFKSHLPAWFFDKGMKTYNFKTIVGLRNVKDVLVSYYNFYRMNKEFGVFDQDFKGFFKLFQEKKLVHGDYISHVLGWWAKRGNPNIYFIKYEDLKADPRKEIIKMAAFLGKTLTEVEIELVLTESSFKSMQDNSMVNKDDNPYIDHSIGRFIRKGQVGDWKNYFNKEQLEFVESRLTDLQAVGLELTDSM